MNTMIVSSSWRTSALLCCVLSAWPIRAHAYRPFDSTDAAVAAKGEMEIECGPVGYVVDADGRFVVVPGAILNFGFTPGWELVIEGRHFLLVQPVGQERRHTLKDAALSLKGVLREGSLQERKGPSVGLEVGLLLPGVGADAGLGTSVTGIISQRWSAATMHFNGTLEMTHDHTLGAAGGAIVEGPSQWMIRPVAELRVEQDAGPTVSGLIGAIWSVRHNLSVDAGWRVAHPHNGNVREFRAGLTWGFAVGGSGQKRGAPSNASQPSRISRSL
jgi:hypothetical protein